MKRKTGTVLTPVVAFEPIARALAEVKKCYGSLVFDCRTRQGDKDARRARQEIKDYLAALEKARVAAKAPLLENIRVIDSEAKRIKEALESLKGPIHDQIVAEETRAERERQERVRAEQVRVEAIEARIEEIRALGRPPLGATTDQIEEADKALRAIIISEEAFEEFVDRAAVAWEDSVEALGRALDDCRRLEAERAQAAADREELRKLREQLDRRTAEAMASDAFRHLGSPAAPAPGQAPAPRVGVSVAAPISDANGETRATPDGPSLRHVLVAARDFIAEVPARGQREAQRSEVLRLLNTAIKDTPK